MTHVELKPLSPRAKQIAQTHPPLCLVCGATMIPISDQHLASDLGEMFQPEESHQEAAYACPACKSVIVAWSVREEWYAVHYDFQSLQATDLATGETWQTRHERKGRV